MTAPTPCRCPFLCAEHPREAGCDVSRDGGRTWSHEAEIPPPGEHRITACDGRCRRDAILRDEYLGTVPAPVSGVDAVAAPGWVEFPSAQLPAERRDVLIAIAAAEGGHSPATAVGYLRHGSGGPFFVVPGFGRPFTVTHWCDCLGDGFRSPAWPNSVGQHGKPAVAAPQPPAKPTQVARGIPAPVSAPAGEVAVPVETKAPVPVKPEPAPRTRECTCVSHCRGPEGLAPGWFCGLRQKPTPAVPAPGAGEGEGAELTFAEACSARRGGKSVEMSRGDAQPWNEWAATLRPDKSYFSFGDVVYLSGCRYRLKPPAPRPRVAEMAEEAARTRGPDPVSDNALWFARVVKAHRAAVVAELIQGGSVTDCLDRAEAAMLGERK